MTLALRPTLDHDRRVGLAFAAAHTLPLFDRGRVSRSTSSSSSPELLRPHTRAEVSRYAAFVFALERWLKHLVLAVMVVLTACTKSEPELKADDRALLERIVAEDVRASKGMAEADEAARKGDVPAALEAVDQRVTPAIEAGPRITSASEPRTEWGRAKAHAFTRILEDRRAEVGPYKQAVQSGDATKLIAVIESQAKIERRALTAIAEVNEGR